MARLVFAVMCRKAVIDRFSNAASIFDVIDGLATDEHPEIGSSLPADINVIASWARDVVDSAEPNAFSRCRLVYPDGSPGKSAVLSVSLASAPRARNIFRFVDLEYRGEGEHAFQISLSSQKDAPDSDWREVFRVPFMVRVEGNKGSKVDRKSETP